MSRKVTASSATRWAIGPGAFAIVRRSKSGRAKRAFTSPPQWATSRRRGASDRSSSPKRGLSQVVTSASAPAQ